MLIHGQATCTAFICEDILGHVFDRRGSDHGKPCHLPNARRFQSALRLPIHRSGVMRWLIH
jgi:hypothetical protein